jgi:hypothetical protein
MPALSFLAFVGFALIALLFYGNATLESISPALVTTHHAVAPAAAAPNVAQIATQPQSAPDALSTIGHAARAARAEAPPKNKRVSQTLNYQVTPLMDRFSIKGY